MARRLTNSSSVDAGATRPSRAPAHALLGSLDATDASPEHTTCPRKPSVTVWHHGSSGRRPSTPSAWYASRGTSKGPSTLPNGRRTAGTFGRPRHCRSRAPGARAPHEDRGAPAAAVAQARGPAPAMPGFFQVLHFLVHQPGAWPITVAWAGLEATAGGS